MLFAETTVFDLVGSLTFGGALTVIVAWIYYKSLRHSTDKNNEHVKMLIDNHLEQTKSANVEHTKQIKTISEAFSEANERRDTDIKLIVSAFSGKTKEKDLFSSN
jgi:hypothetical protein